MRIRPLYLFLCLLALCAAAGSAMAQTSRLYFAGYMGLSTFGAREIKDSSIPVSGEVETKNAMNFGAALGFRLNRQFRIEGELGYMKSDLDSISVPALGSFELGGEMKTYTAMINAYYDFDLGWAVQPFIGGGIGLGFHDGEIDDVAGITVDRSGDDMTFLYQVGGGLKYRVSDDMAFTGAYRYLGSSDLEFGSTELEFDAHEFRFGLEYDLPVGWDGSGQ